jgi:hypothetical protein
VRPICSLLFRRGLFRTVGFFLESKVVEHVNKREVKWRISFFESEQVRPFLYIASRYALEGMGGQVEVRFRVGLSSLSQSDLRVFGPFEVLVGSDLERPS